MNEADWRIYRRNLPHWRMNGATYFVTWRLRASQPDLTSAERTLVLRSLMHFHGVRYDLLAFVVMNDHVHVVVTPMDGRVLEEILYSWKSYTSHQLKLGSHRASPIWLDESFDRIVRDEDELEQKVNYILGNPWKRWPELQEYEWVGMTTESEG